MSKKMYLSVSILCGILSQGIIGTFLKDNYNNSSNIHFRKKRIIDNTITGHIEASITDVPYIVKVLQNGTQNCAGIIVSPEHILTAKICVDEPRTSYLVESGGPVMTAVQVHNVENIIFEGHLALLVIRPYILFQSPSLNRNIIPYERLVWPRTHVSINGWGTNSQGGKQTPSLRRSTYVPVIGLQACFDHYIKHNYEITGDDICTLEPSGEIGCTPEDGGSALVLYDKLVGVLIFAGRIISPSSPDVFIRVNDNNTYYKWIMSHILPYFPNEMQISHIPNLYTHRQHPHNQYSHPHTSHNQDPHIQDSHPHTSHE